MTTGTAHRPHPSGHRRRSTVARTGGTQRGARALLLWGVAGVAIVIVVTAMLWSARTTSDDASRPAPAFTLTNTSGATVRLADLRGKNVLLYFNEGAGCQSCFQQMVDIERNAADFAKANITVLPIVMSKPDDVRADMSSNGVRTPYLLDDGAVSKSYGTLGKGMHAGLPGHSFVLIDRDGVQRWYGEYPSMFLASADLLNEVHQRLP